MSFDDFQTYVHTLGDTLTPFAVQLLQDGEAVDLSGCTCEYLVTDEDGNEIIEWTSASITSAADGYVQAAFASDAFSEEGDYWIYFRRIRTSDSKHDTFPQGRRMKLVVVEAE